MALETRHWLRLWRRCRWEWFGVVPVMVITLVVFLAPTVMPHLIFGVTDRQKALLWYDKFLWLSKGDVKELSKRDCAVLFFKEQHCSCADRIISSIMARGYDGEETIYSSRDWRLVKDPKMTIGSFHYTAWSTHGDLRTAGELRHRHVALLKGLLSEGTQAVLDKQRALRDEREVAVFLHFPPNIFRLHVHFVPVNRTMWAPADEVVPLEPLIQSLQSMTPFDNRASPLVKILPRVSGSHVLTCQSWG
ncbi:unnamed protein product [Symbiodinium sp. CCMP2592]|nr:unnamed protein product [Symbiodinium sp. CCMP2592]